MRTLHRGTLQRPVSGLAALALLAVYGLTLLLALVSLFVPYVRTMHAQEATNPELAPARLQCPGRPRGAIAVTSPALVVLADIWLT